jgi:hypothetical protein
MAESSPGRFLYIKRILVIIGILNILEGFHVLFKRIPATALNYNMNYIVHGIFHFIVGLLMLYVCASNSFFLKKHFISFLWIVGSLLIGYSIVIIITQQNAVKFGYQILYPFHAVYYLIVGLFILPIFYRPVRSRRSISSSI